MFDSGDTVGTDEAADGFATMNIGQFVVRPVTVRMLRVHAPTPGASANLILARDAAGMHGTKSA